MWTVINNNGHYYQGTRGNQSVWVFNEDHAVKMPTEKRASRLVKWLKAHRRDRTKTKYIADVERLPAGQLAEIAVLNAIGRRSAIRILKKMVRQKIGKAKGKENEKSLKKKYRNIKRPT